MTDKTDPKIPYIDYDEPPETQSAEKRLLVAVVQRAIIDYSVPVADRPHLQYWASAWLWSDSKEIMSLFWICAHLSEDPDWLISSIRKSIRTKVPKKNSVVIRVEK